MYPQNVHKQKQRKTLGNKAVKMLVIYTHFTPNIFLSHSLGLHNLFFFYFALGRDKHFLYSMTSIPSCSLVVVLLCWFSMHDKYTHFSRCHKILIISFRNFSSFFEFFRTLILIFQNCQSFKKSVFFFTLFSMPSKYLNSVPDLALLYFTWNIQTESTRYSPGHHKDRKERCWSTVQHLEANGLAREWRHLVWRPYIEPAVWCKRRQGNTWQ